MAEKRVRIRRVKPLKTTPQEEVFCVAVATGVKQLEAYFKAYPKALKWKSSTVSVKACEMFRRPHIAARINELRDKIADDAIMSRQEALLTMSAIGRADLRNVFDEKGVLKSPGDIDDKTAIALIEYNSKDQKAKLISKIDAIKEIIRHHDLAEGRTTIPGDGATIEDQTNALDWARRIAFVLRQGGEQKKKLPA